GGAPDAFDRRGVAAGNWGPAVAGRGEQDYGHVAERLVRPQGGGDRGAVHARHHEVDDRGFEVIAPGGRSPHLPQRLVTALKALPLHPPRRDVALEDRPVGPVVVDDRDVQAGQRRVVLRCPRSSGGLAEQGGEPETAAFALLTCGAAVASLILCT